MRLATLALAIPFALFLPLAGCGDDTPSTDGGTGIDAPPRDGGGEGASCGGFAGLVCDDAHFCDYADNSCGGGDGAGTCAPRPTDCQAPSGPRFCGCDGQTYASECEAQASGSDVAGSDPQCATTGSLFACGYLQCDSATSYCVHSLSDVVGLPDGYSCADLPAACDPTPSCSCLADANCGTTCEATGDALTVTCPGG